jgi:hypothetical protein
VQRLKEILRLAVPDNLHKPPAMNCIPSLVIVPEKLPVWAQVELQSRDTVHGRRLVQIIWNGHSKFFFQALHWNISGLYHTAIREAVPRAGVSASVVNAVTASAVPRTPLLVWDGQGFAASGGTVQTSMSLPLTRQLAGLVPAGGSVVVLSGNGAIRDQEGSPLGKGISWQPHPVGQALTPVMLAIALAHPPLFRGLQPTAGPQLLDTIAARWDLPHIKEALVSIGFGSRTSVRGQPLTNPRLPEMAPAVLSAGRDLWGTADEVAAAYLPFINDGTMLPLHWGAGVPKHVKRPSVIQAGALHAVDSVIPTEFAAGVDFHVWRPDANFMVAYTQDDGGMILVLEGPATSNTLQAVQQCALWLASQNSRSSALSGTRSPRTPDVLKK